MELIKHELYKILSRKFIYITAAALMFLYIFTWCNSGVPFKDNNLEAYKRYKTYEGAVTEEKVRFAEQGMNELTKYQTVRQLENGGTTTFLNEEGAVRDVLYQAILDAKERRVNRENKIHELNQKLQSLTAKGKENSYEYKVTNLQYSYLRQLKQPQVSFQYTGWINTIDFINTYDLIIIGVLVLLGLSPIFSQEYSSGVDSLILSSKNGKRKIVTAKCIASAIYIMSAVILFSLLSFFLNTYFKGLVGGNQPLQSFYLYRESPYDFTLSQYYLVALAVHIIGALAFGFAVLLISSLSKSSMVSFFTGGVVFGLPIVLDQALNPKPLWVQRFIEFSYTELIKVKELFIQFKTFNILGQPVIYPVVIICLFIILSVAVVYLTYTRFKNYQVS